MSQNRITEEKAQRIRAEIGAKHATDLAIVVELFHDLGFDTVAPAEFATHPLRETDSEIAPRITAARKALKSGKAKAAGEFAEIEGSDPVEWVVVRPGTAARLALALDAARPGLLALGLNFRHIGRKSSAMRSTPDTGAEQLERLHLFAIRLGVSPYQAVQLLYPRARPRWFDAPALHGLAKAYETPTQGLPYAEHVSSVFDARVAADCLVPFGSDYAEAFIRENDQTFGNADEIGIHLTNLLELDPPATLHRPWAHLITCAERGSTLLRELGAQRPLSWLTAGGRPYEGLDPYLALIDAEVVDRAAALDMFVQGLEHTTRPGVLKRVAEQISEAEQSLPQSVLDPALVARRAGTLVAVVGRNQPNMARELGTRLIRWMPEEELPNLLATLAAVKARNVRTAVLMAGFDREDVPSTEVIPALEQAFADLVVADGDPRFVKAVQSLREIWVAEESDTTSEDLESLASEAYATDAAIRSSRSAELAAARAARGENLTLKNHEFTEVWRVPNTAYELREEHGVRLVLRHHPKKRNDMSFGRFHFWVLERTPTAERDIVREFERANSEKYRGMKNPLDVVRGPLSPSEIAALLVDFLAFAKAKKDSSDAPIDVFRAHFPGREWHRLLWHLGWDDRAIETTLRRLDFAEGTSPQPLLSLIERNPRSLGVLWPLWPVLLDRAVVEAGEGPLPRWTAAVMSQMLDGAGHLAEAVRRRLVSPDRAIGTGLRQIAARKGRAVTLVRACEILELLNSSATETNADRKMS